MANNSSSNSSGDTMIKYGICLKNHATNFGDYSVDGCREFVKKGDDGIKKNIFVLIVDSLYRPPILRSHFFHPHVNPHGGGNAPQKKKIIKKMTNNSSSNPSGDMLIKYDISLKNYATNFGDYSVDGCREFVKKGDDGTKEEYICANCGCFRSFHRMNSPSLYRPPILRSCFFHPNPHGGGNTPVIFHPFMTRFVPVQYIIRLVFYYYP
ncbi:hypothetical protein H5410_027099 [Solanum commersonii]|uniref:ZF-HD dimerization-type domain-containing protein n=1 Tax=Solanum commersonii TaxID=4109 RepID=A0A9J5Z102_SOLCO|nr:hypothetical protein H5410_027099 [Solanum commersonii]